MESLFFHDLKIVGNVFAGSNIENVAKDAINLVNKFQNSSFKFNDKLIEVKSGMNMEDVLKQYY